MGRDVFYEPCDSSRLFLHRSINSVTQGKTYLRKSHFIYLNSFVDDVTRTQYALLSASINVQNIQCISHVSLSTYSFIIPSHTKVNTVFEVSRQRFHIDYYRFQGYAHEVRAHCTAVNSKIRTGAQILQLSSHVLNKFMVPHT